MNLADSYLCKLCPGNLRISPAAAAEKHKEWHAEQDRRRKDGDWMFGSTIAKGGRRRSRKVRPKRGLSVKAEGIPIKNVNRAMADD